MTIICELCGRELESEIAPHSGEDCIAHVKMTYPWVCEQICNAERARCIALVCPACAAGEIPVYTTAGTGGIQPEPRDWYHLVEYGIRWKCKAARLHETPADS